MTQDAPGSGIKRSGTFASRSLPSEICMNVGRLPHESDNMGTSTADLVDRNNAHGNTDVRKPIVEESNA